MKAGALTIDVQACNELKSGVSNKYGKPRQWTLYAIDANNELGKRIDNLVSFHFFPNGRHEVWSEPENQHGNVQIKPLQQLPPNPVTNAPVNRPTSVQPQTPLANDGNPLGYVTVSEYRVLETRIENLERWVKAFTNTGDVPA